MHRTYFFMSSLDVFNHHFMSELRSTCRAANVGDDKPDIINTFNTNVSVEKFISNVELNLLNFLHSIFFVNVPTMAKIEDLTKNTQSLMEFREELIAMNIYDEDFSAGGSKYTFLKSCFLNNLFTMSFGFDYPFCDQDSYHSKVNAANFIKLKSIMEMMFNLQVTDTHMSCLRHAVFYEITRLNDLFIEQKKDIMDEDDPKKMCDILQKEPTDDTLDALRTKFVEYLITSGHLEVNSIPVICPNIFHFMIRRAPSGTLYFKSNPCILNEYILQPTLNGTTVAMSMLNVFFLCVHKHRLNILKLLIKTDYKNSRKLNKKMSFYPDEKSKLRFDSYNNVSITYNENKQSIFGVQEMTILYFALRLGYTAPMLHVLIGKIIEAYREVKHYFDADEEIKQNLVTMVMDIWKQIYFELFCCTVTILPFFSLNRERWSTMFQDLLPNESHFDFIFHLNTIKCKNVVFERFTIHDVIDFACFSDRESSKINPENEELCAIVRRNPFFLPLVYVKMVYNICFFAFKKSLDFLKAMSEFYIPQLLLVVSKHIEKLILAGFDKSDFMLCCKFMLRITQVQSEKKDGCVLKLKEMFEDFFDYWIMKEDMEKEIKYMEEFAVTEKKNECFELQQMDEEDRRSKKSAAFALLQAKKALELKRKEEEMKEKQRKMEIIAENSRRLKEEKMAQLEEQQKQLLAFFANAGDVFSEAEKSNSLSKLGKTDFAILLQDLQKKKDEREHKKLLMEEKLKARQKEKEDKDSAKKQLDNLMEQFEQVVSSNDLDLYAQTKSVRNQISKHSVKVSEKVAVLENFLGSVFPHLVSSKTLLKKQEVEAAEEAKVAAEETIDVLSKFYDSVKALSFKSFQNRVVPNLNLRTFDAKSCFESLFRVDLEKLKSTYLKVLLAPNLSSMTKSLIPFFNTGKFKGHAAPVFHDFMSKILVVMSFLSEEIKSKLDVHLVLKGSSAINYYAQMDCLDLDFCFVSSNNRVIESSKMYEDLSASICFFLSDLLKTFYEGRIGLEIDYGSFKDSNDLFCTLKLSVFAIADKMNCSYFNKVSKKLSGLSFLDFNFGLLSTTRFRESKYSLVFNLENDSLRKVDKGTKDRVSGKESLLFGSLFLPTFEALIEERLYYLVLYSQNRTSPVDFTNLEEIIQTKRDPILFYIHKTMKQLKVLLQSSESPSQTLKQLYASVKSQEINFPDFEEVVVFRIF